MKKNPTRPRSRPNVEEKEDQESPDHWGDEKPAGTPPSSEENPEFWGEERSFQIRPVLELGEASFHPLGGLTLKDIRVADKGTLLIVIAAAFGFLAILLFAVP